MEKLQLKFTYEKETKNTIRYQEELGYSSQSDIADSPAECYQKINAAKS